MPRWTLPLILAALLPGCTLFGGGDAPQESAPDPDPYGALDGPHAILAAENVGPNEATVTFRVVDASGVATFSGNLTLPPQGSVERPIPIGAGPQQISIFYSWSHDGSAASGTQDPTLDPASCGDQPPRVQLTIDTRPGATSSHAVVGC